MTQADPELAALWAADEPPERDQVFVLAVMAEVEQRRFWVGLASLVPVTVATAAILWALSPMIRAGADRWMGLVDQPAVIACAAGATLAVWLWTLVPGQPAPVPA